MTTPMKSPPMPVAKQNSTVLLPGASIAERGDGLGYALGYGERELRRLMLQSRMLGDRPRTCSNEPVSLPACRCSISAAAREM